MKTNTQFQFLANLFTFAVVTIVAMLGFTQLAQAQFFSNSSYESQTTTRVLPVRGGLLAPRGYSAAHPNDDVRQQYRVRSGNGYYESQVVQRQEYANRVIVEDPRTGHRQAAIVQTSTVTKSQSSSTWTPRYNTTVQVTYAPDAPKYSRQEFPAKK